MLALLETVRKQGWARTNEEYVQGVVGCAVPITARDATLIACLGVSVPAARVSFEDIEGFIEPLKRASSLLAETILANDAEDDT